MPTLAAAPASGSAPAVLYSPQPLALAVAQLRLRFADTGEVDFIEIEGKPAVHFKSQGPLTCTPLAPAIPA